MEKIIKIKNQETEILSELDENELPKPNILIAECLEFNAVRYNGNKLSSEIVRKMRALDSFNFFPICPEVQIGMGVPRKTVRIVMKEGEKRLIQPETDKDFTDTMIDFAKEFLPTIEQMDGFILTNDSPSTGVGQVKHYHSKIPGSTVHKMGSGIFAEQVIRHFPGYPIESHRRLQNKMIAEIFFTKVFALAKLRTIGIKDLKNSLIEFQNHNRLLFQLYNAEEYQNLTNLITTDELTSIQDYRLYLLKHVLIKGPDKHKYLQVFNDMYKSVEESLQKEESVYYHEQYAHFQKGLITKVPLLALFKIWAIRFKHPFLQNQSIFNPFPIELLESKEVFKANYLEISYRLNY